MKLSTQKELWNLLRKLDTELPEDTDMEVFGQKMVQFAQDLGDPIPVELQEDLFESVNSVAAFRSFDYFCQSISKVYSQLED